jgi:hypothetical protein
MPSAVYELFRRAIRGRHQVSCVYLGCRRQFCPHILGHGGGEEKALVFQFAGESTSGLPPGGEWRCLVLSAVSDAVLHEGPWHTGPGRRDRQHCVSEIDLDVDSQDLSSGHVSDRASRPPTAR